MICSLHDMNGKVRKYSNAGYSSLGGALNYSASRSRFHAQTGLNEDWLIERGRGKTTGRKERKKKIQLHLWDSNTQPLAYMDKDTLPLVLRESLKW